ncbi:MAG: alginate lyase family protein, partial [Gemmatimonadetes bacterium]|nr:alginate lyase family protein [Gemmatimonadota bacterium]
MRRLRGRSAAELRDRAAQAARVLAERAGFGADAGVPTLAEALDELRDATGRPFASIEAAHQALSGSGAHWLVPAFVDRAGTLAAIDALDPEARARILRAAERFASGRFDLLGYEALSWGTPIDWHLDPVAGRRAPDGHWSQVPFLDAAVSGDHKVTWEVNRHQWLVTLAQAYWLSGDEHWAERALAEVDAWIVANPAKRGINWASMLEVAFRSIAWLWVLQLVRGSRALTAERHVRMLGVLARAGRHVADNLSTWFSPNTHLTGEALALHAIGTALPALRDADRFRATGEAVLAEWLPRHVRPDGTYVEQSTWYARYTADFLVHAIVMGEHAGRPIPGLRAALDRIATMLLHVRRADGTFPLIGDDDGGRYLFLDARPAGDVRPTLAAAAALLGRSDLTWGAGPCRAEAAWLLGARAGDALASAPPHPPEGGSRAFADGGLFVMRDGWGEEASMAVIDCGPHGFQNSGHAHADLLGFDLTLRGRPVVRDPGTYTYTSSLAERVDWRSAARHAAATVDGTGSATPSGPFTWAARPATQHACWTATPAADLLVGTHDGFAALGIRHRRVIVRAGSAYWLVLDTIEGAGEHELMTHLPLAPGLAVDLASLEVRAGITAVARLAGA